VTDDVDREFLIGFVAAEDPHHVLGILDLAFAVPDNNDVAGLEPGFVGGQPGGHCNDRCTVVFCAPARRVMVSTRSDHAVAA
jgi:hypothetical protein